MKQPADGARIWQTRWEQFIREVVADFQAGMTDRDVTDKYSFTEVTWTGTLREHHLSGPRSCVHVQMEMPMIVIPLDNGRRVEVDFLSLSVDEQDRSAWQAVNIGDVVQFVTTLSRGIEPFPGIEWSEYDGVASILVATERSRILAIGSR